MVLIATETATVCGTIQTDIWLLPLICKCIFKSILKIQSVCVPFSPKSSLPACYMSSSPSLSPLSPVYLYYLIKAKKTSKIIFKKKKKKKKIQSVCIKESRDKDMHIQ